MQPTGMLNILSLDGGPGPLGQIELLRHVVEEYPGFLSRVGLFAGTSDGALMSLYMARELSREPPDTSSPEKAREREREIVQGCKDFAEDFCKAVGGGVIGFGRFVVGRPLGDGAAWRRALKKGLGDTTLADLAAENRHVAIVSFDTKTWGARVFRNFGKDVERDGPARLWEVALSTSAMPPLLPIFEGPASDPGEKHGYLDGFLACNNPTMSAVSLAAEELAILEQKALLSAEDSSANDALSPAKKDAARTRDALSRMTVLSLGCCQTHEEANLERRGGVVRTLTMMFSYSRNLRFLFFENTWKDKLRYILDEKRREETWKRAQVPGVGGASWGWPQMLWRPTFFPDLLIHGTAGEIDRQCRRLLGKTRYHRCELSTNQMRNVADMALLPGGVVRTRGTLDWEVLRALKQDDGRYPRSGDEDDNVTSVDRMLGWIEGHWFEDPPPP